jgi:Na+/H+ antiporter NhaD/arsenite permease-like protein
VTLQAWLAIAVFAVAYVLIATERVPRVAAALGGAAGMILIGATDGEHAFFDEDTAVDWNVIFLLLGMMVIVGVLRQTGLFEYLALWSAKKARGRPFGVMTLLVLLTAVASAALDNVTTVLLVAPVTLLVCERLGVSPIPYLLAEAMASNIGGTATLIGDPPNIIIASRADLSFADFLVNLAPLVVVLLAVFVGLSYLLWGRSMRFDAERAARVMALEEREAITDPVLLRRSLIVLGAVLVGFTLHTTLHLEPSVVALLGAGAAVVVSRLSADRYLDDVEWETLVFFMGLFVMVGALVNIGVIEQLASAATDAVGDRYLLASTTLLFGSAVISGIVDNIPYVATMAPLVGDLVAASDGSTQARSLWWALALGADLGGNATAVGASANVVVTGIAARNGHPISFWTFTKYGIVVTLVTVLLAWPYLWLRYFVLAG